MRFLVKVNIPVEAGHQAVRAGKLRAEYAGFRERSKITCSRCIFELYSSPPVALEPVC